MTEQLSTTKKRVLLMLVAAAATLLAVATGRAQTGYRPSAANLAAREWFQDARFGLFVHWGVYSVLGDGEWVMNNRKIPAADYEKLPSQFNPVAFDPVEWVALAKAAGMKYITITSKHHGLRDVRLQGLGLQHRRAHAVQERRPQGARRGVSKAGPEAVLLPFTARLASS
jgi:hypothetical protein